MSGEMQDVPFDGDEAGRKLLEIDNVTDGLDKLGAAIRLVNSMRDTPAELADMMKELDGHIAVIRAFRADLDAFLTKWGHFVLTGEH